jgi:Dolichyl-phosphate-mannose-protein mannosyltransferase
VSIRQESALEVGLLERSRSTARAVPVPVWLAAIVTASVLLRFLLSLRVHAPWVFQDEAVYGDLARSLGQHGHFAMRQAPGTGGFGVLYPLLLAPAWAIFSAPAHAYVGAKLINAVLMSLAAIPAYLIARRVMRPGLAVVAALFAVAIPSLAYVNTLLSENAFYPATMAAAAALFLLLERPTLVRQVAFFALTVLAFLARAQGVILLPALVIAIAIVSLASAWEGRRFAPRAFLRDVLRFRVSLAILVGGVAAVVVYEIARGRSISSVLGTNAGVTSMHHPLGPTLRWIIEHFGELDLYLGVIPFVAMVVIVGLGLRPAEPSPALRAFAASSLALVVVFVATAGAYATDFHGQRIEERYMFEIAPLFFIALMAWIERGLPRPLALTGVGVALGAGLAALVPYDQLITTDVVHDAFALVPLLSLELKGTLTAQNVGVAIGIAAIAGALVAVLVRPRFAWILPAVVLVYYGVIELRPIQRRIVAASQDALGGGITVRRNWIDHRVGAQTNVALLVNGGLTALPYWENEFFNRSVRTVYTLAGPFDSLPREDLAATGSGVLHDPAGKPMRHRYVLSNYQVVPAGTPLEQDKGTGMTLYQTAGQLRIEGTLVGVYPDRWSGGAALWTQYGCHGGVLRARVLSDPGLYHHGRQGLAAQLDGKTIAHTTVPTTRPATFTVPLPRRARGACAINFLVNPTAVPAQVFPGNGDTRTLGIRFLGFDYEPGG